MNRHTELELKCLMSGIAGDLIYKDDKVSGVVAYNIRDLREVAIFNARVTMFCNRWTR